MSAQPVPLPVSVRALAPAGRRSLPALDAPTDWKEQRRLWGHAFHPMCSYLGSFRAPLAHAFVNRLTRPGDSVLDPYCGRGTVPLEAVIGGRIGVGIDANPLAHMLTAAKVSAPSRFELEARLARLHLQWFDEEDTWSTMADAGRRAVVEGRDGLELLPPAVADAFAPATLAQLLYLRWRLQRDDRIDRFLIGALLGILHGRSPGYLSDVMPNGFSLSPEYATRAARGRRDRRATLHPDPFLLLARKVGRLTRDGTPRSRGVAVLGDAIASIPDARRAVRTGGHPDRFRLVMTSPPYLSTLRYGSANWLRLWFLGADPLAVDAATAGPGTSEGFGQSINLLLGNLRNALTDDAVVVLVLGDVGMDRGRRRPTELDLAQAAWELGAEPEGYRLAGVIADPVPPNRKLTRLWGPEAGRTTTVDQILVVAPTELGRRRAAASLGAPLDWSWPRAQATGAARQPLRQVRGRGAAVDLSAPPTAPRQAMPGPIPPGVAAR